MPAFNLGASLIPRTDALVYLGVTFKLGGNLTVDFLKGAKSLYYLYVMFLDKVDGYEYIFSNILMKKCLPILNYALECIYLDSASFNTVSKSWDKAIRWLFNRAKYESTHLSFLSCNTMPMRFLLDTNVVLGA